MGAMSKFLRESAVKASRRTSGKVQLTLAVLCLAGWTAAHVFSGASGEGRVCLAGLVLSALAFAYESCLLIPFQRIQELERARQEPKASPLEIEVIDRDLDASSGRQCSCLVRVVNRGPAVVYGARVELIEVDESVVSEGMTLPHELTDPLNKTPFIQRLGKIQDDSPGADVYPGSYFTREGLVSVVLGKPLFIEKTQSRADKLCCAFANTGSLIEMTDIAVGKEYRFRLRATGRDVPPKEADFAMRVIDQSCPRYRVTFLKPRIAPQRKAGHANGNAPSKDGEKSVETTGQVQLSRKR
jgi:hypothetical protein